MNTPVIAARVPDRLLLTLKLGEVPEHLPGLRAVKGYGTPMADAIDRGVIDRLLRHHGDAFRVVRLHSARTRRTERAVAGSRRFDEAEQLSGVARVLRVEVRKPAGLPVLLRALAELPTVERVGADHLVHAPFDTQNRIVADAPRDTRSSWAHEAIHLREAHDYEAGDPAVIVGLADTGVATQHAELAQRLRAGFDSVDLDPATVAGLTLVGDFRHHGERPQDEVGHGTGCAGIIIARGRDMPPGGAGACGLTPVRVLGAALGPGEKRIGVGALDNIDAGMKRLIDLGVKVINMSFGTPESALDRDAPRPHEEIVRYALARGVILVAASGNSGLAEKFYPAAHAGVIAIGAVDQDLRPTSFTTRGDHVAVCAPGRDIFTCSLNGYQTASGTSFASPFAAAVCGLLASRAARRAWPLESDDARQILIDSARPFANAGQVGYGRGVVDAIAALRALDARIDAAIRDEDDDDATDDVSPAQVAA